MTPTDEKFAQLDRIEQECFHGSWTPETLLSEINSPLNVLCTEESGGITAGFALGRVVADEAELFQIAVLPELRRQGIAQRLLERLHGEMDRLTAQMNDYKRLLKGGDKPCELTDGTRSEN